MAHMSPQTLLQSSTSRGVEFAFELVDDARGSHSGELAASEEQCAGCKGCAADCSEPDP
jgi:hypothetical protein